MTFAYADPPYLGQATEYRRHHPDAADYNGPEAHRALIERLHSEFPDGWALSASMTNLWDFLPMIPKDWKCRIAAWCKPFGSCSAVGYPQRSWEPVLFCGGRQRPGRSTCPPDFLVSNSYYASHGHKGGNQHTVTRTRFPGAKPDEFCYWLFDLLNMRREDTFIDLFPGTGRVARAWEHYKRAGMTIFSTSEADS